MWVFVRRGILPGLLLIGGLVSLIYGSRFHFVPVLTTETTETTIDVPVQFSQIPPPFPGAQEFGGPPQFRKQTEKITKEVTITVSEPALIRDVTVGGVALNKSLKIERTYSGKAPSLCPT
ncbi:MAG: hypothetical protein ABSG67_04475 [Thermoguttaceae bacterium]|jgi:hypothetical protein